MSLRFVIRSDRLAGEGGGVPRQSELDHPRSMPGWMAGGGDAIELASAGTPMRQEGH